MRTEEEIKEKIGKLRNGIDGANETYVIAPNQTSLDEVNNLLKQIAILEWVLG